MVLALFPDIAGASNTVSQVIAGGFLPAALEIMDRLAIKAVNDMYKLGLPEAAGAALLSLASSLLAARAVARPAG